jgi:hypothetical protein
VKETAGRIRSDLAELEQRVQGELRNDAARARA